VIIGLFKVGMFPGLLEIEVAKNIDCGIASLKGCNTGGEFAGSTL
jgi:hypothetical protein